MAQTDRQTDKATFWAVTAFNDDILSLEDATKYPACVKSVSGGRERTKERSEEYPEGRLHFQGHIHLRTQQRLSWFKSWLPTAHLEVARNPIASKAYAMKSDTADGDKLERINPVRYYSPDEICLLIGSKVTDADIEETIDMKVWFKRAINRILRDDIKLAGQLMNPSLRNFWCDTCRVWIDKSREIPETEAQAEEEP